MQFAKVGSAHKGNAYADADTVVVIVVPLWYFKAAGFRLSWKMSPLISVNTVNLLLGDSLLLRIFLWDQSETVYSCRLLATVCFQKKKDLLVILSILGSFLRTVQVQIGASILGRSEIGPVDHWKWVFKNFASWELGALSYYPTSRERFNRQSAIDTFLATYLTTEEILFSRVSRIFNLRNRKICNHRWWHSSFTVSVSTCKCLSHEIITKG